MKKIMRSRKSGFTLVELLIVIILIAILAGMMLLTMGPATDGAEASKLVNNLRSMKQAALLYYLDNSMTWIPADANAEAIVASLSVYIDRSIDTAKYEPDIIDNADGTRAFIGFTADSQIFTLKPGVKGKLKGMAMDAGLYRDEKGAPYEGEGPVYVNLR